MTSENFPALQSRHATLEPAPISVEYFPFAHNEQEFEPMTSLYLPAEHAVHSRPFGPVYPISQEQAVKEEAPDCDVECTGQFIQDVLPTVGEYVAAPQSRQVFDDAAPMIGE